ncbi:hypothetical protein PTI98_006911 [Pleurotus ostreatus]|nr:hypothetical protein PTI98_006911 [Pleurotus ostreatus]
MARLTDEPATTSIPPPISILVSNQHMFNQQMGVCATVYHDCTVYNKNPTRDAVRSSFGFGGRCTNGGAVLGSNDSNYPFLFSNFPFLFFFLSAYGTYGVVMSLILILGGVSCSFRYNSEPLPLFSVLMLSMLLCCYQRSVGLLAFAFQTKYSNIQVSPILIVINLISCIDSTTCA